MKIYVVGHKKFELPPLEAIYCPIMVGSKKDLDVPAKWLRDDDGENVSNRNSHYCELTALFWIWKHGLDDVEGLCHYRRYFVTFYGKVMNVLFHKQCGFLTEKQIRKMLKKCDVIRHNPTFFKDGVRKQFEDNHSQRDLDMLEQIIQERQPAYMDAFKTVMGSSRVHLLNMIIAPKPLLDQYCAWLFDILFEYEKRAGMTEANLRMMGFMAERLLDVWILGKGLKAKNCFSVNTEHVDKGIFQ